MVNKQGIWFLTLTSLALVLSVYYITMPNELLISNNGSFVKSDNIKEVSSSKIETETSNLITNMRIELDEERNLLVNELESKLSDDTLKVDEKNQIYEDIRNIKELNSKESMLEKKIKDEFKLDSFIKIKDDTVSVVINSSNHDKSLVVNIMKSIQEEFQNKMYISISFKE